MGVARSLPAGALVLFVSAVCVMPPASAAELIIRNAVVLTMDDTNPKAQAIAIDGGKIVAIGSNEDMGAHITAQTKIYDLPGKLVLPGFQDAHNHLVWSAAELEDISLFEAATKEDLAEAIKTGAAERPGEAWVRGSGWDLSAFPDNTLDKAFLDELVPDRPAYFAAADGHSAWVNSKALELAGITADTKDPEGGRIERDATGAPQGLLREAATALVSEKMPAYSAVQVARGLKKALAEANSYGITAIIDPKAEEWMLDGYKAALDAGTLSVRVSAAVEIKPEQGIGGVEPILALRERFNDAMLRVNSAKLFVDGVIEAKTAAMLEAYVGGNEAGELLFTPEALAEISGVADKAGLQLHYHAIGDRAVRVALDAVEFAREQNGPRDGRHQIAHLEVIDPADIARFKQLGVLANFQGLWAYPDSYITDLTEPVIGPERSKWLYPIGAVAQAGGMIVGGSDWSVSSMNPLEAIQVAVTRQDPENAEGRVLTPEHKVDVMTMLKAYTVNAAYAGFREAETGTLSVGKLADIVVLDADVTTIAPAEIATVAVLMTLLEGKPVFEHESLPAPVAP